MCNNVSQGGLVVFWLGFILLCYGGLYVSCLCAYSNSRMVSGDICCFVWLCISCKVSSTVLG